MKIVLRTLFLSFLLTVGIFVYLFRSTIFPQTIVNPTKSLEQVQPNTPESSPSSTLTSDRIETIESSLELLKQKQVDQEKTIEVIEATNKKNVKTAAESVGKPVFDTAQAQSGVFETTATTYASMGLYTNIKCLKSCNLVINFYTSSRNVNTPNALNTYGVFVDGQDKSVYTQGNIPDANSAVPMALNTTIGVGTGTHTIEIKAKTSGGKLQSDISGLQVIAVGQEE